MVDAVVFLGFVMNLWVSVGHRFWVLSFVDVVVFWVCESLWVSVGFSASASGFFFFSPVVVAGMDMGLLG